MAKKSKQDAGSDSDSAVSESTRAVREIQRQLQADDTPSHPSKRPRKEGNSSSQDKPLGDGRKYGAITGIKLDCSAPSSGNRSGGGGGLAIKGKDGKSMEMGMSLESMVNQEECNEARGLAMPEAPLGSFRRRDMEAMQREGGGEGGGKPAAQKGIDGKVYDFIAAGSDESESNDAAGHSKLAVSKAAIDKQKGKKDKTRKKKMKKESKKHKKKEKKKDKKHGKKKKKKKSSSSSSSSSSS